MSQKEYWNSVSEKKQSTTPFQADELCKYIDKNSKILDVGCGYGRTLEELYQMGYHNLTGVDFSEGMINRGKHQFPYLDLRVMTSPDLDIPDNSVDAVILFAVLTCIPNNQEQKKLICDQELQNCSKISEKVQKALELFEQIKRLHTQAEVDRKNCALATENTKKVR